MSNQLVEGWLDVPSQAT